MRFFALSLIVLLTTGFGANSKKWRKWEGVLTFKDDFDGFEVRRDYWGFEDWCLGKGRKDSNLECFTKSDDNIRVINGKLVLRAIQRPWAEKKLYEYAKPRNYTSGLVRTIGDGFTHGTFVISARMPRGKALLPSIWLVPGYPDHNNCKYEEINIAQARGQKPSNLIFSASFGRKWNSVATKRIERAFPGIDFSKDFHEFALVWKPLRMDWYVDGVMVYTASTHFYSDWILHDESNLPCNKDKSLFKQPLQLTLSMSVGGTMFPSGDGDILTPEEAERWAKPTFEIDWVKVYQF